MKARHPKSVLLITFIVFSIFTVFQCQPQKDQLETNLRKALDEILVINTHEHQRSPDELPD